MNNFKPRNLDFQVFIGTAIFASPD